MRFLTCHTINILAFICALAASLYGIPRIINVANRKGLFDTPDQERKIHAHTIPNLGGIGIFFSFIIIASLFITNPLSEKWHYIVAACVVLFLVGVNDDLLSVSPYKKLLAQLIAAFITVCLADIRLSSLHGLFGIQELSYINSVILSVLGCVFIINAYNLIDGIDGLCGSLAVLVTLLFGICMDIGNVSGAACVAFSLMGATFGFLRYNIAPARVFMGDTGSLLIGYIIAVLSIVFVNTYNANTSLALIIHSQQGAMLIALSFLFVPVFDTFRVFISRSVRGISPFKADRSHLHHYLLDIGLSQSMSVMMLVGANVLLIIIAFLLQDMGAGTALAILTAIALLLFTALYITRKNKMAKR